MAEFDSVSGATPVTVAAICAVHFSRLCLHLAAVPTYAAVVTSFSCMEFEKSRFPEKLQQPACGAGKPAPYIREHEPGSYKAENSQGTDQPGRIGVLKGKTDRVHKLTDPDRYGPTWIMQKQPKHQGGEQNQVFSVRSKTVQRGFANCFKRSNLGRQLRDQTTGAAPAAEGSTEQQTDDWERKPESPEQTGDPSPAGDDRAALAVDKGHSKRATKKSVKRPLAEQ